MKQILIAILMCLAPVFAFAAPHHFDTPDHVCVETRWDSRYGREFCSIYEQRVTYRAPAPVYIQHRYPAPRPVVYHQHHRPHHNHYPHYTPVPRVSVNIQHRDYHVRYEQNRRDYHPHR